MGFFERLKAYLSRQKEEPQQVELQQVYCQYCNNELTETGGDISYFSGKIYCNGYNEQGATCGLIALFKGKEGESKVLNYHDADKTQKAIQEGKLTQFNELEKIIENSL